VLIAGGGNLAAVYAGAFFIVLLHEFGHCIAAQRYGIEPHSITLYPFGGAARMRLPVEPVQEFVVALAGPLVNALLIAPLWFSASVHTVLATLCYINIAILLFNLLPIFPMDGGRVLRSLLSMIWKNHERATVVAGRIGQVGCIGFAIVGIMSGRFMLVVIGAFIAMAAEQEIRAAKGHRQLQDLYRTVTGDEPPAVSPHDVEASARMISDIQRRLVSIQSREEFDELSERLDQETDNRHPR